MVICRKSGTIAERGRKEGFWAFAFGLPTYYCLTRLAIGDFFMQQPFQKFLKYTLVWQLALALYWFALFVTTHIPSDMAGLPGASTDKFVHVTAFALLALLLATAWQLSAGPLGLRHLALAWILLVVYGAIDEWTQSFVRRQASIWDFLGDAVGALIGLVIFAVMRRLFVGRLQRANSSEM
jgi:VanZ family protein